MDELELELKTVFLDEATQSLDDTEQSFLELEGDPSNPSTIEKLFRLAHNLKGTSRAVGFGTMAEFTHNLEDLLLKLKNKIMLADGTIVSLLLECNDHLKKMVVALKEDMNATIDSTELIAKIQRTKKSDGVATGSQEGPGPVEEKKAEPTAEEFDALIEAAQNKAAEEAQLEMDQANSLQMANTNEEAKNTSEEIVTQENNPEPVSIAPPPVAQKAAPAAGAAHGQAAVSEESIRVSVGRLEKLSDFVGELVILQSVMEQQKEEIKSSLVHKTVGQIGKIIKEIRDISMSLRMVPLKQTFQKLNRIVRDTSKALDKKVDLQLFGEDTEVDKTVLEHLGDPLVHIVRNAIDHGLESTEERIKAGKSEVGKVSLRAMHQGNNLVIEMKDDGKGIDTARIRQKAIEKGVIKEGAKLSESELRMLIFAPGFSTKSEVSEISGRGVGLDVVKTNIEGLSGEVQLDSEIGKGSTFRLLLPLTLAIIDGLIIRIGSERYVIPLSQVHETVRPEPGMIHVISGVGEALKLRGDTLSLFRLSDILKRKSDITDSSKGTILIVRNHKGVFSVMVDDIIRQQQVVIKKIGDEIKNRKGLMGSAILGDGKPALIVDLTDLINVKSRDRTSSETIQKGVAA